MARYDLPKHYKTLTKQDGASVDAGTLGVMMETMAGFCENTLAPLNTVGDQVHTTAFYGVVVCCVCCFAGLLKCAKCAGLRRLITTLPWPRHRSAS